MCVCALGCSEYVVELLARAAKLINKHMKQEGTHIHHIANTRVNMDTLQKAMEITRGSNTRSRNNNTPERTSHIHSQRYFACVRNMCVCICAYAYRVVQSEKMRDVRIMRG